MSAQTTMTMTEAAQSLTGYEEQAITKAFGRTIEALAEESLSTMARALVFALGRRAAGADDKTAKAYALSLTRKDLDAYFPDDVEEIDPDDPDTPAGKDSEPTD